MKRVLLGLLACVLAAQIGGASAQRYQRRQRQQRRQEPPKKEQKPVQDHYKILGVARDASQKEIRKAYRKLSVQYHPDKNKDADAQVKFDQVTVAYETLGDEDSRQMFDNFGGLEFSNRREFEIAKQQGKVKTGNFYKDHPLVKTLGDNNFGKTGRGPWLVKFYAPWCQHCRESVKDFKKAALHLDGEVNFGAVNCDDHQYTCQRNRIFGYPAMMFIDHKKDLKEYYQSEGGMHGHDHSVDALTRFVMKAKTNRMVNLSPANFQEKVIDSKTLWLVDFSAGEWCGPCTMTKPAARKAASELHGIAKVGYINCDGENQEFCSEQGVSYYPFLMVYPRGTSDMKRDGKKELDGGQFPKQMLLDVFSATAKASLEYREGFDAGGWRDRLMAFYEENNPAKIEILGKIIDAYLGEEDYLWKQLHQKYELDYTPLEDIMAAEEEARKKEEKAFTDAQPGHSEL